MISLTDYCRHDGLGLAELVAKKEVEPKELVEAALAACEKVNPKVNAVIQTLRDEAMADVRRGAHGPFAGVPFVIKELILHAKGVRCDSGSKLAQGFVADADTELMARFRGAGLLLTGTTQTPELGYNPTTEAVLHGPTRNPWDLGRSPGGSSGGSGAAVASGIVPIGHASDGGGSIRIPASANGLVGLKPTRDRVPTGPDLADPLSGLAVEFAVTKTVRDAAALLDAVAGPDVGAPSHPVPPARPWSEEVGADPGKLSIAFTTKTAGGVAADPECVAAVQETARLLESLGHHVVEDAPRYDWDAFLETVHPLWTTFTALFVEELVRGAGTESERTISRPSRSPSTRTAAGPPRSSSTARWRTTTSSAVRSARSSRPSTCCSRRRLRARRRRSARSIRTRQGSRRGTGRRRCSPIVRSRRSSTRPGSRRSRCRSTGRRAGSRSACSSRRSSATRPR